MKKLKKIENLSELDPSKQPAPTFEWLGKSNPVKEAEGPQVNTSTDKKSSQELKSGGTIPLDSAGINSGVSASSILRG